MPHRHPKEHIKKCEHKHEKFEARSHGRTKTGVKYVHTKARGTLTLTNGRPRKTRRNVKLSGAPSPEHGSRASSFRVHPISFFLTQIMELSRQFRRRRPPQVSPMIRTSQTLVLKQHLSNNCCFPLVLGATSSAGKGACSIRVQSSFVFLRKRRCSWSVLWEHLQALAARSKTVSSRSILSPPQLHNALSGRKTHRPKRRISNQRLYDVFGFR